MAETVEAKGAAPDGVEEIKPDESLRDNLSQSEVTPPMEPPGKDDPLTGPDLPESGEHIPDPGDNVIPFSSVSKKQAAAQEEKQPEAEVSVKKARGDRPASAGKSKKAPVTDKPDKPKKVEHPPRPAKSPSKDKIAGKEDVTPAPVEPEQPPAPRDASEGMEKEEIVYLNLAELHPFKNHPFGVRDDAEMRSLVESVKAGGVHQPAIVRPREGGGYEIITGHRRQKASELAGYTNIPCIVRNYNDDEAILKMTDDNLRQRSVILPSEKAKSLKMQVEAIKHQGARGELGQIAKDDIGKRSTEIVGQRNSIDGKPMNSKQVQRYVRLTSLVPELLDMADKGKLSFTPAVEMSFIKKENQQYIAVSIEGQQSSPSLTQAQELRRLDQAGRLNPDMIDGILCEEKKEVDKVIINAQELSQYFGKDKTPREMKDQIMALLADWKEKQPPELAKPAHTKEAEK